MQVSRVNDQDTPFPDPVGCFSAEAFIHPLFDQNDGVVVVKVFWEMVMIISGATDRKTILWEWGVIVYLDIRLMLHRQDDYVGCDRLVLGKMDWGIILGVVQKTGFF
jgi:hypothetical protein